MKDITIRINIITILAIVLIMFGLVGLIFYLSSYTETSCKTNPGVYLEEHWFNYFTDKVRVLIVPIDVTKRFGS